ncbi:MAG TPA: 4-hydroxy-tetrahydrodipicolinate reductase [Methanoregulaceae archaeon]|nr:4-hydroxy-tetrahydrodipicolinate reductase [Methanoregulaceae archaeon]
MIKVVVAGAFGRMGTTLSRMIAESDVLELVGGVDVRAGTQFGADVVEPSELGTLLEERRPDVLMDFTVAAAAVGNIRTAADHGVALVVGTTGFSDDQAAANHAAIDGRIPAVISSNYAIGVNVFWQLIRAAAPLLAGYDIEVIEAHHRYKKDAPSGTAKTILTILDETLGERKKVYGREGMAERGNEIGVHAIRGGDIVGDHAVLFAGNYETITLSHRAYDRAVLATGALRAAEWVVGRPAGVHTFAEVLGLGAC